MIYQITDLHCKSCAIDLENKINQKQNGEYVKLDYEKNQLKISEQADLQTLHKVLDFEKVIYIAPDEEKYPEKLFDSGHESHHSHSHDHGYSAERNTGIVFFLNAGFAIVEFIFGNLFNSAALLADAVHDTGDALSIGLAWMFQKISTKEADEEYPFGYQRFSPLGAIVTAVVLIVGSILMMFHSIPQILNPTPVNYQGLLWLSIIAIGIKLFSMYLMGRGSSQNEKMLNLHMLEDVFGWVAVLAVSIVLHFTDWYVLDPILSIFIAVYILYEAIPMFIDTVKIFLETTPEGIELEELEEKILKIDYVDNLSHLHVWTFDGEENILNVTISTSSNKSEDHNNMKNEIRKTLFPYNITHSTVEIIVDETGVLKKREI